MATALSLVCGDCGAQLRSAEEAQDHADVTGHANFAESTEPVRVGQWTISGMSWNDKWDELEEGISNSCRPWRASKIVSQAVVSDVRVR